MARGEDTDGEIEEQSPQTALFWEDASVDPVEIAFPKDVGYTLRHYRTDTDEDGNEVEEAVFLAHEGTLHLFRSAEGLVEFLRSGAPHDLTTVDGWAEIVEKVTPADIVPDSEDRYELDLVVENLRGGADVWDPDLVIGAGEIARDLGFALGLREVLVSLEPGSPLDALDEGIRAEGFLARRRLRKISAEQVAIGWRTMIGKLATATEWHD
ncbi:MAG TPA: hypothetical protein VGO94_15640 [Mycobacteriales bacterium]|nr:hypothetical protein [Cryptosporangiaceae bacterium]HEV7757287.1 hypothetical protein [Mycobacteriales bacterium]